MRQARHTMCDVLFLTGPSGHTQRSVGRPPALHTHRPEDPWPGTQRCSKASVRLVAREEMQIRPGEAWHSSDHDMARVEQTGDR